MEQFDNPILDAQLEAAGDLFGDVEVIYDEPYGLGTWVNPLPTLIEAIPKEGNQYGFRIGLKFNLKGDTMPYTGLLSLRKSVEENGDPNKYEWALGKEIEKQEVVNRILAGLGSPKQLVKPVDTPEAYQHVVNVFTSLIGAQCPLKITADGKNKKDEATGKWTFEPNGFTRLDALRPRKKK